MGSRRRKSAAICNSELEAQALFPRGMMGFGQSNDLPFPYTVVIFSLRTVAPMTSLFSLLGNFCIFVVFFQGRSLIPFAPGGRRPLRRGALEEPAIMTAH